LYLTNNFLVTDLKILEKYYDIARIIDPLATAPSQPTIFPTDSDNFQHIGQGYHFGNHGQFCKQCIGLQAIHCQETFIKTEMLNGSLFLITAMPLEMDGRTVALELIKCINEKTLENFFTMPEGNTDIYRSIAKLNDLVYRDDLTNMYNRRYIDEQLPMEIAQARQHNLPFSIVMTDIDYFKQVNDQFGHSVGDEVLKYFAAHLQNNIRQNSGDWVVRYGGEEFLITLINCSEHQAYEITEKIRKIIEDAAIPTAAGNLHITASFGVHTFSGQESDLHQLVDKVDKHLYQAKQAGRNCTVSATRQKS
jgi:diguanylate cyclase (GGDEF)-like protein